MDMNRARDLQDEAARRPPKRPEETETFARFVDYCDGPDGEGWYVLEHRRHPDGTVTYGYATDGPFSERAEADDAV